MFQFVRHAVAALLNRLKPFSPPEDPYAPGTGAASAQS